MKTGKIKCTFAPLYSGKETREKDATTGGAALLASIQHADFAEPIVLDELGQDGERIEVSLSEDVIQKLPYLDGKRIYVNRSAFVWEDVKDDEVLITDQTPEEEEEEEQKSNIILGAAALLALLLIAK